MPIVFGAEDKQFKRSHVNQIGKYIMERQFLSKIWSQKSIWLEGSRQNSNYHIMFLHITK
jgi:hypothetical protein